MTSGMSPTDEVPALSEDLAALRAEFPGVQDLGGVTSRAGPGTWPGACTQGPARTRSSPLISASCGRPWKPRPWRRMVPFSPAQPNIARMYDYWLQGKDHYPADRAAADASWRSSPRWPSIAQANRAFLARAVRHVARQGITQFIDLGSGLPTSPNTHEVAREITPDARVCYVDNDPLVLAHARALLAVDDHVSVAAGDIRAPGAALARSGDRQPHRRDACRCACCWCRSCTS